MATETSRAAPALAGSLDENLITASPTSLDRIPREHGDDELAA